MNNLQLIASTISGFDPDDNNVFDRDQLYYRKDQLQCDKMARIKEVANKILTNQINDDQVLQVYNFLETKFYNTPDRLSKYNKLRF